MNESANINMKNFNQIVSKVNYETIVKNYFSQKKGLISVLEASKFFSLPQNQKKTEKDIIIQKNGVVIHQRRLNINRNINIIPKEEPNQEFSKTNKIKCQQYHSCQRLSATNQKKKTKFKRYKK